MSLRPGRGIVLATALFVTMVLYLLVVALLFQAHENIRLTSAGHQRVLAHFAARGAAQVGLSRLNTDPSWLNVHKAASGSAVVPPQAETVTIGGQQASVWVEASDNPDFYSLVGYSQVAGMQRRSQLIVAKDPLNHPQIAGSTRGSGVFLLDPRTGGGWQPKTVPPRFAWQPVGGGWAPFLSPPAPDLGANHRGEAVAGLPDSAIYLSTRVDGRAAVLMLPVGSSEWSLLPPVLLSNGQQAIGVRVLGPARAKLFAMARTPSGRQELLVLDNPGASQTVFHPVAGTFTISPGGWRQVSHPATVTEVEGVAVSQNGMVYVMADARRYLIDTSGNWTLLPSLPFNYWARTANGFEMRSLASDSGVVDPKGMTADARGNLYVNRQVNGYSTFYKYIPARSGRTGYYRILPPVPQPGSSEGVAHDFGGYLYVRLTVAGGPDSVLFSDVDTPGRTINYQPLPTLPSAYGKVDAIGSVGIPETTLTHYRPIFVQ
jgi:hypothetical protein